MIPNYSIFYSTFISRIEFIQRYQGVISTFSEETTKKLLAPEDFSNMIFLGVESLSVIDLIEGKFESNDVYQNAILNRIIVISCIMAAYADETINLDIVQIWPFVSKSLVNLPEKDVTSSIGSQGFLSIPLYEKEGNNGELDLLKLHIWDDALNSFIDREKVRTFSVHSHKFHAKSWIVCGEIYNTRYIVEEAHENLNGNYFEINWLDKTGDFNTRTSVAKNTGLKVKYTPTDVEKYLTGDSYEIAAGEFHKSEVNANKSISSTLFLFSTRKGKKPKSFVIGPPSISVSEVNRKMKIIPNSFLTKISDKLSTL